MGRKERKERRLNLIREWALVIAERIKENKDISQDALIDCFRGFCVANEIQRPQDKSLRHQIIIGAADLLELIWESHRSVKETKAKGS